MLKYILRRILIFIPTLFAISLIAFVISINAPGDPVENLFAGSKGGDGSSALSAGMAREKEELRHELGLDLPVFYFTLSSLSESDTLHRIRDKSHRENLERLINKYGNWEYIQEYYRSLINLRGETNRRANQDSSLLKMISSDSILAIEDGFVQKAISLLRTHDETEVKFKIASLQAESKRLSYLGSQNFLQRFDVLLKSCNENFTSVVNNPSRWKSWIPSVRFYGYNQYHRWLFGDGNWITGSGVVHCRGIIRGDFGVSYATRKPVTETIARALPWSMTLTLLSVFFAYLISIPIGIQAAEKRGSFFDRSSSVVLFMLYSLPSFFMGTLLLMTFANPDVFSIFPANGVGPASGIPENATLWEKFNITWPYLVLPLICYTYSSLAFLSRTMRVAMLEISSLDFMRTAHAKGLSRYLVYYKHGFRNALLPIITVFANIFPLAVGGSVILEYLFGIPGMGPEILTAVQTKDYPMIVAVFTLSGFMTLIGYLVADILYAVADPRISYSKS
jgi:peptide/nickel transport system permease protein